MDTLRLPIEDPPEFIPWEPTTPYEIERNKPTPSVNHSRIQANLTIEFAKQREFSVYPELDIRLGGRDFTPDLCVYPREPFRLFEDISKRTDAPLLIVEILSNSQGTGDVYEKIKWYLADGGVEVHPATRILTDPATGLRADFAAVLS